MRTTSAARTTPARTTPARGLAALASALLVAGLGLAACSSPDAGGSDGSASVAVEPAPDMAMGEGSAMADTKASVPADREVVRTAWLSIRVEDVNASAVKVSDLATARGGTTMSQDRYSDGANGYANVTVKVPVDELDAFLAELRGLGNVENESVSAVDVTVQGADLDARITALTASVTRLQELLDQAENVADLVAIESELATRQAELDGLEAQRRELSSQVAMSSVTVNLSPLVSGPANEPPGFVVGLQRGWQALVSAAAWSLTTAGFALPFLAIAVVAGLVIGAVVLAVRRSRRRPGSDDGP